MRERAEREREGEGGKRVRERAKRETEGEGGKREWGRG